MYDDYWIAMYKNRTMYKGKSHETCQKYVQVIFHPKLMRKKYIIIFLTEENEAFFLKDR